MPRQGRFRKCSVSVLDRSAGRRQPLLELAKDSPGARAQEHRQRGLTKLSEIAEQRHGRVQMRADLLEHRRKDGADDADGALLAVEQIADGLSKRTVDLSQAAVGGLAGQ